jgi:hypothetical protein
VLDAGKQDVAGKVLEGRIGRIVECAVQEDDVLLHDGVPAENGLLIGTRKDGGDLWRDEVSGNGGSIFIFLGYHRKPT